MFLIFRCDSEDCTTHILASSPISSHISLSFQAVYIKNIKKSPRSTLSCISMILYCTMSCSAIVVQTCLPRPSLCQHV